MASNDEKKKGLPTGAIVAIVLVILAIIAGVAWYMYSTKGANAVRNIGTPAPGGNAAVVSMPSPNNVSAGNGNVANGRVGAQV
jgi:hypothetical protein